MPYIGMGLQTHKLEGLGSGLFVPNFCQNADFNTASCGNFALGYVIPVHSAYLLTAHIVGFFIFGAHYLIMELLPIFGPGGATVH
jgi:hypothetical protein